MIVAAYNLFLRIKLQWSWNGLLCFHDETLNDVNKYEGLCLKETVRIKGMEWKLLAILHNVVSSARI